MLKNLFKTVCWGSSVALSWTWGIGLFFSVQMAIHFGIKGLLTYATINAFGLTLFGLVNSWFAKKFANAELYEENFLSKAKNFKSVFYFYQFIAITLTLFAVLKYVTLPMGILSALVCVMFIGATIFLGEEFKIKRIKYSHFAMAIAVFASLYTLLNVSLPRWGYSEFFETTVNLSNVEYAALWVPIIIGFLAGPWLDLQQWQRAIQIRKENLSISNSYVVGGVLFWMILISHGLIALSIFGFFKTAPVDSSLFFQAKDVITQTLYSNPNLHDLLGFYIVFVCLAALATFDSGYVALKWFTRSMIKNSKSILLSFVPTELIVSPVPLLFLCVVTAISTIHLSQVGVFIGQFFDKGLVKFFMFELEYYVAFYASFFVMFAVTFVRAVLDIKANKEFLFLKLLSTGLCSISIFGIGYFTENTILMAIASIIPLIYGMFTLDQSNRSLAPIDIKASVVESKASPSTTTTPAVTKEANSTEESKQKSMLIPHRDDNLPEGAELIPIPGCYIHNRWFVYSFISTYQDTNSVGNIYFATYGMWVGKSREMFFLHTMPGFDPKTSDFLILTRSYEHKFVREAREFEPVSVHIRIKDYNRKFVTLEHKIFNSKQELLGKGQQSLMFVDSKKYNLIDIPKEIYPHYAPFAF